MYKYLLILCTLHIRGVISNSSIKFQLNDPDHKEFFDRVYVGFENSSSLIDPTYPFKFIIHGYIQSGFTYYNQEMPPLFLAKGNYNVIALDWRQLAAEFYPISAANTKVVGNYLGQFIVHLNQTQGVNLDSIHIIGHSLGAHVAGFAGKFIISKLKRPVHRISGLDPASPLFETNNTENRLTSTDGKMVDILHTDGHNFGINKPIGTVDFYANEGTDTQPGCETIDDLFTKAQTQKFTDVIFCSHRKSVYYYMESIYSKNFIGTCRNGVQCSPNNTAIFGDDASFGITGIYDFKTNSEPPFAQGP